MVDWLTDVDWGDLLVPQTSLAEIVIRGTAVYLVIFALLRFVSKRQSGALGMTGLLLVVLIADAAQNAMAADYQSLPDGLLLVAVIVGWSWVEGDGRISAIGRDQSPAHRSADRPTA